MARQSRTSEAEAPAAASGLPDNSRSLARIASLLALLLVKGQNQTQQVATLTAAGFKPSEISSLIGVPSHQVSVLLHQSRTKKKPKKGAAESRE